MNLFENLQKYNETSDKEHKELIDTMLDFEDASPDASVGIFWYDFINKKLFGVNKIDVDLLPFNNSGMKTYPKLHKSIWRSELYKSKNEDMMKYEKNYTLVPRGRIFQMEDGSFEVMIGKWINEYPECKEMIITEFDLPKDKTSFKYDGHWDIGRGWSEELFK